MKILFIHEKTPHVHDVFCPHTYCKSIHIFGTEGDMLDAILFALYFCHQQWKLAAILVAVNIYKEDHKTCNENIDL